MSILPSCKNIKVICPYCGQNFTYVRPYVQDRFEYIINTGEDRIITCPICLEEMDLGTDMICTACLN
jgi:uncharacterized Zn-finger protein